jgi:methylglutaconyl-CoA hydratase
MVAVQHAGDGVAHITMNRPAVFNAFDEHMIAELDAAFAALAADASVRVIVLQGAGKHFSAGADLQWMQRASTASLAWNQADARRFAAMLGRIDACPKPTVARVQGAALGGGVGLVCACDMAVAADNASFSASEAKFGILPAVIGPYLTNAVGKRQARYLALTTARVNATQALGMGLVQELAPLADLDAAVQRTVVSLLQGGPQAHAEIKQLFAQLHVEPVVPAVQELTASTIARVRGTPEAAEGFAAFLAKRPPAWAPKVAAPKVPAPEA